MYGEEKKGGRKVTTLAYAFKKSDCKKYLPVPCVVSASDEEYLTAPVPSPEDFHMLAEWDTGATESAISKGLVDFLGLKSTGTKANLFGGNGIYQADTYRINLYFENGIVFKNLTVSEMPNNPSLTVLVGLDVILQSDFAVIPSGDTVNLYFRHPSEGNSQFDIEPQPMILKYSK